MGAPHAAMETTGPASMKSASTASTTAASRERIVGNEARGDKHKRCHGSEKISKHGVPPLIGVPCIDLAMPIGTQSPGSGSNEAPA